MSELFLIRDEASGKVWTLNGDPDQVLMAGVVQLPTGEERVVVGQTMVLVETSASAFLRRRIDLMPQEEPTAPAGSPSAEAAAHQLILLLESVNDLEPETAAVLLSALGRPGVKRPGIGPDTAADSEAGETWLWTIGGEPIAMMCRLETGGWAANFKGHKWLPHKLWGAGPDSSLLPFPDRAAAEHWVEIKLNLWRDRWVSRKLITEYCTGLAVDWSQDESTAALLTKVIAAALDEPTRRHPISTLPDTPDDWVIVFGLEEDGDLVASALKKPSHLSLLKEEQAAKWLWWAPVPKLEDGA